MNLTTTLRPSYQAPMYEAIPVALRDYKWVIVQSPAGSGKSVIMSHTVARIINAGRIPLVLTHRITIQTQLLNHCQGISIDSDASHVFIRPGHCFVAMSQTLIKRPNIMSQLISFADNIIILIDECHYGIFNKLLDLLPNAYRVGFSATPAWRWAKHLSSHYNHIITGPQISTLISEGSLCGFDYYEMKTNLDGLTKNTTGDFSEQSQFEVFDRSNIFDGLTDQLKAFEGKYKKGAIFCSSIKQCDKVHATLKDVGYNPVKCHSKLKDATYQKAQFEILNESNLMVSVSSLAEGWDFPSLDFEVLYRATTSLPLYIQMGMRCSRPSPGKKESIVVDFGGNNTRFGGSDNLCSMTMDRDWEALSKPPIVLPKTGQSPGAIKYCPACDYLLSALARSCCNCGYIYPEAEILLKQGELVRIEQQAAADKAKVQGRRISTLDPIELAYYAKTANKKKFAMRIAKSRGVTESEYLTMFGAAMGYKSQWADRQLQDIAIEASYYTGPGEYNVPFADVIVNI